jgi:cephalosporin-C deacetylase-like acetyl esterase
VALIEEISSHNELLYDKLKFDKSTRMDLTRLVCGGHSFGAMTAIAAARIDNRVKACITLDPWLFVRS